MTIRRIVLTTAVLGAGLALGGCASCPVDDAAELPIERYGTPISSDPIVEGEKVEGLEKSFYRAGRFVIGAQPTEDDLIAMRRDGVGTVINLRSIAEAEDRKRTPINAPRLTANLGMGYHHIPLGGDDGYEPADVDAFAALLDEADGDVLVHCASGGRARSMMSAWLITRRGWSEDQAKAWRRTVGEKPGSLEQLLTEPEPDEG